MDAPTVPAEAPSFAVALDPGAGRSILDCALVARGVRVLLESDGIACWPKTSGSKGIHVMAAPTPAADAVAYAKSLAQRLEALWPDLVVHKMAKELRPGRILVDWAQNNTGKTTAAPYTLRAGPTPGVSAPLTWAEIDRCHRPEQLEFTTEQVLQRAERHGDLLAGLLDPDSAVLLP